MPQKEPWLTTGDLARLSRVPQQTLISWDRNGVLKARARPGRRASPRAPRRYDEHGLIAALFARSATEMGFKGDELARMVRLVQAGNRADLERAAIFTFRAYPGMLRHVFSADVRGADDQRYVAWLREEGILVEGPTSLWTTREAIRPMAHRILTDGPEIFPPGFFEENR